MTDRELMQQALEAWDTGDLRVLGPKMAALRERLAQPEQEPDIVEFRQFLTDVHTAAGLIAHGKQSKALAERLGAGVIKFVVYTAQPLRREWVGLEEWELSNVYFDATGQGLRLQDKTLVYKFARAIEAKLREKNG